MELERRENMSKNSKFNVRKLTIIAILGAIPAVFGMTPLGFIPVGPTKATIMHIPVIIGAIMEGPIVGGCVGLIFGLFSIFQALTNPTPVSFVFLNPLISILPRVLIGVLTHYVYDALRKMGNKKTVSTLYILWAMIIIYLGNGIYRNIVEKDVLYQLLTNIGLMILTLGFAYLTNKKLKESSLDIIISTIIGTLANTVGVLVMIYLIYGERFVESLGQDANIARKIIFGIGLSNGITEVIIAIIIVTVVVGALKKR